MADSTPRARRDRVAGLLILLVAFTAALTIAAWAKRTSLSDASEAPEPPTTDGLLGFPNKVDPIVTLEFARSLTKRPLLRGIVAMGVKTDGTVDLDQPGARVRYVFDNRQGEGPQPPRPPGTLAARIYCGQQSVRMTRGGIVADPDQPAHPCTPVVEDPLPDPQCGAKDVWQRALARGAPSEGRARIEYYRARGGPAWRFEIPGLVPRFSLYGDCERPLAGDEAIGEVP